MGVYLCMYIVVAKKLHHVSYLEAFGSMSCGHNRVRRATERLQLRGRKMCSLLESHQG